MILFCKQVSRTISFRRNSWFTNKTFISVLHLSFTHIGSIKRSLSYLYIWNGKLSLLKKRELVSLSSPFWVTLQCLGLFLKIDIKKWEMRSKGRNYIYSNIYQPRQSNTLYKIKKTYERMMYNDTYNSNYICNNILCTKMWFYLYCSH